MGVFVDLGVAGLVAVFALEGEATGVSYTKEVPIVCKEEWVIKRVNIYL